MTRRERLIQLFDRVALDGITKERLLADLSELRDSSMDDNQREKLDSAIKWVEIYFSENRWKPWGSKSTIKHFVLMDIAAAKLNEP
jgi:hypothetical protein